VSVASLIEAFIGQQPRARRRRHATPARRRNPKERKSLAVHVDEDELWRTQFDGDLGDMRRDIGEMRVDIHGIRKILLFVAFILLGSKGLDLAGLTSLIGQ
jgi:hypothetical protein